MTMKMRRPAKAPRDPDVLTAREQVFIRLVAEEVGDRWISSLLPVSAPTEERAKYLAVLVFLLNAMGPAWHSYRSGALTFDSVVFEHPGRLIPDRFYDVIEGAVAARIKGFRVPAVVRRVAAMLAVRTRRQSNG